MQGNWTNCAEGGSQPRHSVRPKSSDSTPLSLGLILFQRGSLTEPPEKYSYGHEKGTLKCKWRRVRWEPRQAVPTQIHDPKVATMAVAYQLLRVQLWVMV